MVVTPDELEDKIWQKEKQEFKELEREIDAHLRNQYKGNNDTLTPYIKDSYDIRDASLKKLLKAYEQAGWVVEVKHYSFGSDRYIEFSKNKQKKPAKKKQQKSKDSTQGSNLKEPDIKEFEEIKYFKADENTKEAN